MQRDVFSAIADPTRREIIEIISKKAVNIHDLASAFSISRPAVRKHVRILQECGMVKIRKEGKERYCQPNLEALGEIAIWVHQYRRFWNAKLDRLEELLKNDHN